jgi:hypothetical protein
MAGLADDVRSLGQSGPHDYAKAEVRRMAKATGSRECAPALREATCPTQFNERNRYRRNGFFRCAENSGAGSAGNTNLNFEIGVYLPGTKIKTSPTDFAPLEQLQMMRFKGESGELFGPIMSGEKNS